jgi:hypothetical protein
MPLRHVPSSDLDYYLVCFDEGGQERLEADASRLSERLLADLASAPEVTDVFVTSHGWKGDVPAAIGQYDKWIAAMGAQDDDRSAARRIVPGWRAVTVGVHWPSLPWGDESPGLLGADSGDDLAAESALPDATLVDRYAARIGDNADVRAALSAIVESGDAISVTSAADVTLSPQLHAAYQRLFTGSGLDLADAAAAPGRDQERYAPAAIITESISADPQPDVAPAPAGPGLLGGDPDGGGWRHRARDLLLSPVRQLSFWQMKARARAIGEGGVNGLLREIQRAAPNARIHLMGHSFGCIVVTAAICGPVADGRAQGLPRPVDTLFLVQGAMSLWSYADELPFGSGGSGYYRAIRNQGLVNGAVVTTQSSHDKAVGIWYPRGAAVADEYVLGEQLPKFGALGTFGVQGLANEAQSSAMLSAAGDYFFEPGRVYNLDASRYICHGKGASGAHSDIAHPEVAHAFWRAAIVSLR